MANKEESKELRLKDPLYTLDEVMILLTCARPKLMGYIESGELKAKMLGSQYRVLESDLMDFIHQLPDAASEEQREEK